jgi:hypothetical protein
MLDFADFSKLSSGVFSNIVNNPIGQSMRFDAAKVIWQIFFCISPEKSLSSHLNLNGINYGVNVKK